MSDASPVRDVPTRVGQGRGLPARVAFFMLFMIMTAGTVLAQGVARQPFVRDASGKQLPLYSGSYALVMAASRYKGISNGGWAPLPNVEAESKTVVDALVRNGFTVSSVLDPDDDKLYKSIKSFLAKHGQSPRGRLLVYYSGHGHSVGDIGYLVPVNAPDPTLDPAGFEEKALSMQTVVTWAKEFKARHALFVFDSCFSGAVFSAKSNVTPETTGLGADDIRKYLDGRAMRPVRQFISAGSENEQLPSKSVFTPLFVRALNGDEPGLIKDGYIFGKELGYWLERKMGQYTKAQSPRSGTIRDPNLDIGDMVFQVPDAPAPPPRRIVINGPKPLYEGYRGGEVFQECEGCPEMVVVSAGRYRMGSPAKEVGRYDNEGPEHEVVMARPFALSRYEITGGQYKTYRDEASATPSSGGCSEWTGKEWKHYKEWSWNSPGYPFDKQAPVTCVSWDDARGYIDWLGRKTVSKYRLPTEAEWEYGARAGSQTSRHWGDDPGQACRYANVVDQALKRAGGSAETMHECDDKYVYPAPVGKYQSNAFGLYDMIGNVWEWTEDCWNGNYEAGPSDGSAWTRGECSRRVIRGGGWNSEPRVARSAFRYRFDTGSRYIILGFRVARTLP